MLRNLDKAPFPYFGGKRNAAPIVWSALGDVEHYVEPFAGSLAVLLCRPHEPNRAYHSETVNDVDGLLVNAWRAIQLHPDAVAAAASWPVSEVDIMARKLEVVRWIRDLEVDRMRADPLYCDAKIAGWWMWAVSGSISITGDMGSGPWIVGPDGRVRKRPKGSGQREPGASRGIPHLSSDGQGMNHAGTRESGVAPGALGYDPDLPPEAYHSITMPELRRWMSYLSARLRHVRILQGDWRRAVTNGASKNLSVRKAAGHCGIFLDPPYAADSNREMGIYREDCGTVADDVNAWCVDHGDDPNLRIVLAGFDSEHSGLVSHGWREVEWFKGGFLKGGMGNLGGKDANQQHRERLWLSPHCLGESQDVQVDLFGHTARR